MKKVEIFKNEIWKDIQGYENLYQVSNLGRVKSLDKIVYQKNKNNGLSRHVYKGKILKNQKQRNGYLTVDLHNNGNFKRKLIHRLVAEAFISRTAEQNYVNHIDCDTTNNNIENLEWCSQSENIQHAYNLNRKKGPNMKKVNQYDLKGDFIKCWSSQSEVERCLGIFQANIYKVCSGKRKQAGGYLWKYAE